MKTAFLDTWIESERGWGQKNDGCSIHLTKEDYKKYVKRYCDKLPDAVPDEYQRPDSNLKEVVVSDKLFKRIQKTEDGLRLWESEYDTLTDLKEILFTR